MGYLLIEKELSGWTMHLDGRRVHGVFPETREDAIHWALWRSRGRIPDAFVAPLAMQSITDILRRAQATTDAGEGGAE